MLCVVFSLLLLLPICGSLLELVFLCIEYGKFLPWLVWFIEGLAPLLLTPLTPPSPLIPPTDPYWILPACDPTIVIPPLFTDPAIPIDEVPGPLLGLLWLILSWGLCEWWVLGGAPCCYKCRWLISVAGPPNPYVKLFVVLLLFWKDVDTFVLIILLILEMLDTPTYDVAPIPDPVGPFAVATMFMLF